MKDSNYYLPILLCLSTSVLAGDLNPPSAPTAASSAMFTSADICNRLDSGAVGAKRTGSFVEPTGGSPASSNCSLDEIMSKSPSQDNTDGAVATDVSIGKKFWGLQSGAWGLQTGTATPIANAPVAATGQTTIVLAGDNGTNQTGKTVAVRFTDNNNGTVTDNLTGLIWLKNANCPTITRDWATALADITQLNTNGQMNNQNCGDTSNGGNHQTDWRLPNIKELQSLINLAYVAPALSNTAGSAQWTAGDPFSDINNQNSGGYWSSTTYVGLNGDAAWYQNFNSGIVNAATKTMSGSYSVFAVRGGL